MMFGSWAITVFIFATARSKSSSWAKFFAAFMASKSGSLSLGSGRTAWGSTSMTLPT